MATPQYDLTKIKFATGNPLWDRAVDLYESGKVTRFKDNGESFSGMVLGGNPYEAWVSRDKFDVGDCTCYLGKKNELCKHLVALAIRAVTRGKPLEAGERVVRNAPECSGRAGALREDEPEVLHEEISAGMKCVRAYHGPSRTWFAYQASLSEGCTRLSAVFSGLPVSEQAARMVVKVLLRLDRKLSQGGGDDADGTVGGFIEECVLMLEKYAEIDPACMKAFGVLREQETCFDWQEPLVKRADNSPQNMV